MNTLPHIDPETITLVHLNGCAFTSAGMDLACEALKRQFPRAEFTFSYEEELPTDGVMYIEPEVIGEGREQYFEAFEKIVAPFIAKPGEREKEIFPDTDETVLLRDA